MTAVYSAIPTDKRTGMQMERQTVVHWVDHSALKRDTKTVAPKVV
jgi:hypothetical protein